MTIKEIEQQIIEEFSIFDNWMDKYQYIIDLGKSMPVIAEEKKKDENLIKGCQSRVWLDCSQKEGKLYFSADSDAIITKGIISLLIRVYDGHTPQEIIDSEIDFIDAIGLRQNLSPTRANGLVSMLKQIKLYALAFKEKEEQKMAAEKDEKYSVEEVQKNVIRALKQVFDPEIPVNVYDLGLIYEVKVGEDRNVFIRMTMTSPTCPMADDVVNDVNSAVSDAPGVKGVQIELTFEPEWDESRMSDEARLELGLI
ncbi:MAG: SufE family protein [Bacteroidales bacterium]|nr:SufE family protein [Bacteroidales bacterium]